MATLLQIKNHLIKNGYELVHTSKDRNSKNVASYYFVQAGSLSASKGRIRISDHHLGCNQWGEAQGRGLARNIIVDEDLSVDDALMAVKDDDYDLEGYSSGYSYAEYQVRMV